MKAIKENLEDIIKRIIRVIYPVVFFESTFANMISYYITLGNQNDFLRKIISWGLIFICFIVSVSYLIFCLKEKKKYLSVLIIPAMLCIGLAISFFRGNMDTMILKQAIYFVLYGVPALTFAVYLVVERVGVKIFSSFLWVGLILLPSQIIFIKHSTTIDMTQPGWNTFGGVTYLGMAYPALFIIQGLMINILFAKEKFNWKKRLAYALVITTCTLTIVFSGARGALLGLALCVVIQLGVLIIGKYKEKFCYVFPCWIALLSIVCLLFIPSSILGGGRLSNLITELSDGTIKAALDSEESDKLLAEIIKEADNGNGFVVPSSGNNADKSNVSLENKDYDSSKEESKSVEELSGSITQGSASRVYIYKLALKEISKSPIVGMGAVGFEKKYGMYPHNSFLEIMVDYGVPFFIVCMIYICICLICSLKKKWDNESKAVILFCIALGTEMMLSGSLYNSSAIIWIITYFQMVFLANLKRDK